MRFVNVLYSWNCEESYIIEILGLCIIAELHNPISKIPINNVVRNCFSARAHLSNI